MWNITTKPFILISLFSAKQTFNFEEYNFSQSTLEQVGGETKQGVLIHHKFEFYADFLDAYRFNYIQTNHSDIYLLPSSTFPHVFRSLHQAAGIILADFWPFLKELDQMKLKLTTVHYAALRSQAKLQTRVCSLK